MGFEAFSNLSINLCLTLLRYKNFKSLINSTKLFSGHLNVASHKERSRALGERQTIYNTKLSLEKLIRKPFNWVRVTS